MTPFSFPIVGVDDLLVIRPPILRCGAFLCIGLTRDTCVCTAGGRAIDFGGVDFGGNGERGATRGGTGRNTAAGLLGDFIAILFHDAEPFDRFSFFFVG